MGLNGFRESLKFLFESGIDETIKGQIAINLYSNILGLGNARLQMP